MDQDVLSDETKIVRKKATSSVDKKVVIWEKLYPFYLLFLLGIYLFFSRLILTLEVHPVVQIVSYLVGTFYFVDIHRSLKANINAKVNSRI